MNSDTVSLFAAMLTTANDNSNVLFRIPVALVILESVTSRATSGFTALLPGLKLSAGPAVLGRRLVQCCLAPP